MFQNFFGFSSKNSPPEKKLKVDLISLTAHQLKNPLSSMKLSLKMILDGDFGQLTDVQKNLIGKVLEKNEILVSLVDDLLHASKIEEGGHLHTLTLSDVDLEEVIASLISFEQEEIIRKKIEFTFEKLVSHPILKLDRQKISIALQNIFNNAVKYTPIGGKVIISLARTKDVLEIKIQDSGIGISQDQKRKIFGRFFRAGNALKSEIMGSGLGLFIAKDMIEVHHGKIWFESTEGKGSTFFINLPFKPVV